MKKNPELCSGDDYELQEEYDLSRLSIMPKGRHAPERKMGKNKKTEVLEDCHG